MYDPEKECKKIVRNIRTLCRVKSMSINMTAQKAELSTSTLNELINGKTKPQVYTLFKLCNALEVSIEELMMDNFYDESAAGVVEIEIAEMEHKSEQSFYLSIKERELLLCYRYFPEWKRMLLDTFVDMLEKYMG